MWLAFDWNRIYEPQFVQPVCNANADYYILHVLAVVSVSLL